MKCLVLWDGVPSWPSHAAGPWMDQEEAEQYRQRLIADGVGPDELEIVPETGE